MNGSKSPIKGKKNFKFVDKAIDVYRRHTDIKKTGNKGRGKMYKAHKSKKKKNQKARSWYHIKQNWTKLCMLLPCGPAIPFLGSYSEETLPTLHNSETTCCY